MLVLFLLILSHHSIAGLQVFGRSGGVVRDELSHRFDAQCLSPENPPMCPRQFFLIMRFRYPGWPLPALLRLGRQ